MKAVCFLLLLPLIKKSASLPQRVAPRVLSPSVGGQEMPLTKVDGTHCLDGSPAGFYSDIDKYQNCSTLVLTIFGGGACYTESDCAARAKTSLGSSTSWASQQGASTLCSNSCTSNPDFCDACHVDIPYCSGDVWSGNTAGLDSVYKQFYFQGHSNLIAIVKNIFSTWGSKLTPLTRVLFNGPSAGGFGTWVNADAVTDLVNQEALKLRQKTSNRRAQGAGVVVKAAPVAGWFFPGEPKSEGGSCPGVVDDYPHFSSSSSGCLFCSPDITILYNGSSIVSQECVAHNPTQPFLCSLAHTAVRYVQTPMFFAQYQYDSNQITEELQCPSTQPFSKEQIAYVEYFGKAMNDSISQILNTSHGLFFGSCLLHTQHLITSYKINNYTYMEALGDWFWERNQIPHRLIDACIAEKSLPCGACSM